ncbi:hypothetical protein NQ317_006007 [Molorchus minor]|uniref:Peroxiredoxin C-terminal domain-containing protein n=1 Tax=Molorchus minor TaxID=1323400 RepID=A0ABQ9J2I4_9CUCU|nr:hypothetical protein NQ317_006007 [Molorchus minor]
MIDAENKYCPEHALTVRALYIIDPKHVLRLSMFYPASTGRNVDEILRVIDSLQLVDRIPQIATPANWVPGGKSNDPTDSIRRRNEKTVSWRSRYGFHAIWNYLRSHNNKLQVII